LTTPSGTPASIASAPSSGAVSGVCGAGFAICVHPAASAGPSFRMIIASGKFHGVIAAVVPTGCRSTMIRLPSCQDGTVSP
jgi:hypothetical protein